MVEFFCPGPANDDDYRPIRDEPHLVEQKSWLEELWSSFSPFCPDPNHFLQDARFNLTQRFWEMLLAWTFQQSGFQLGRVRRDGPDLAVITDCGTVLVEAVAPTSGSGPDEAVRRYSDEHFYRLDRRAIQLRYSSALADKRSQLAQRLSHGRVGEKDPYVVAVCGGKIVDSDLHMVIPDIVNVLFGLGEVQLVVPVGGGVSTQQVPRRETLPKRSTGCSIHSGLFHINENGEYAYRGISGVLFSSRRIWDPRPQEVGWDFIFIPNPNASNPLPSDLFEFGRTYTLDQHGVRCSDFRRG